MNIFNNLDSSTITFLDLKGTVIDNPIMLAYLTNLFEQVKRFVLFLHDSQYL